MHPKVFACLLLATLIATALSRSMSASHQGDSRSHKHATAAPGPERAQKNVNRLLLVRREWPGGLSWDQKHLVSQFLPHIYAAELSGKGSSVQMDDDLQSHDYPTWIDYGRRSLKARNEDA